MATMIKLTCKNCGKEFVVKKGREKIFCSNNCKLDSRRNNDEIFYIIKKCENCGKTFKSKKKEDKKYCSYKCAGEAKKTISHEIRKCLVCGNEFSERKKHKKNFCSEKCRLIWQSNPQNIEKRINSAKKTIHEKYNVDSLFNLESFQNKLQNCRDKDKAIQNLKHAQEALKEKRNKLIEKRFNERGYKIIEFCKNDLIVQHPDGHIFKNNRKLLVNRLNHDVEISTTLLPISASRSTQELLICKFLDSLNVKYETNIRNLIDNYEIDVYIPDHKLGIELHGLYWHSEIYLNSNYHLDKLNACNKQNIELLQFYEDEIIEKFDIVKSMIQNRLKLNKNKIYARNTIIKEVSPTECADFLCKNHIQGNINSKIKIGLYYNNTLVSLMTFCNFRKVMGLNNINNNDYELLRFCTLQNYNVIGGADKLFKYFIKTYQPEKIITYANKRYSSGNLYKNLNFIYHSESSPNYWYVLNKQREYRFKYRKSELIKAGFDSTQTEHEIMLKRKIYRIYDCGNIKFIYLNKKRGN